MVLQWKLWIYHYWGHLRPRDSLLSCTIQPTKRFYTSNLSSSARLDVQKHWSFCSPGTQNGRRVIKVYICRRYCIYHVKFNFCLVTKPLEVFSSETKWLNASLLFLRLNWLCQKCIIIFGFRMISWIIKTSCLCYLPQPSASADNTDLGFDNSWYHAQPHPIIVYYWLLFKVLTQVLKILWQKCFHL